jgi:phosphoenolpyruvate carboxykinase (ATP)
MEIQYTRAMVHAALNGELANGDFYTDPIFGLHIPKSVPGVPERLLDPRKTWKDDKAYDRKASELAGKFKDAFKPFEANAAPETVAAIPGDR